MVSAHIAGVPIEELLIGVSPAVLALGLAWVSRLRNYGRRHPGR